MPAADVPSFAGFPGLIATTRELTRLGFHRLEVAAWAREGLTERILHGLYRRADDPVPADQCLHVPLRYMAQRCGDRHALPLITAEGGLAAIGVDLFTLPLEPLVLVARECRVRSPKLPFRVRHADLEELEPVSLKGLRLAPPWRLVADTALNPSRSDDELVHVVDALRHERLAEAFDLVQAWEAASGFHPGARRMCGIAATGVLEQESPGEREAFRVLFKAFPPLPDCQVVCHGAFRVDFVFLSAGLIIEYHGQAAHRDQVDRDATRIHALERAGYRVIVVTASMLRDAEGLAAWIHRVRVDRARRISAGELPLPVLPPQPPRLVPLRTLPESSAQRQGAA